jgi:opacity protein-like surface antigen
MFQRLVPLLIALAVFLAFLLPGNSFAYNEDGRFHFEAGFEVLDRDIEEEGTVFQGLIFPKQTTSMQSLRLLAKLSVRIIDPIEIYGLAGGSDLQFQIGDADYNANLGAAYGGGARFILFRENSAEMPFQVFADYRFLRFKTHDTTFFFPNDNGAGFPAGNTGELLNERVQWNEHVFKLGVMGRHDEFEPYGGIRFSFVRGKDHLPSRFQELNLAFKQSDTFGVFFGTSYYFSRSDRAAVFIEASLFDQNSLAGGVRVGF